VICNCDMSANDKTIRIIKREQRQFSAGQQETLGSELKTERQMRREIFETITSWIEEQRQRKKSAVTILRLQGSRSVLSGEG